MFNYENEKTIGVFTVGKYGRLHVKCDDSEIRFDEKDLHDLRHAVDEMIRYVEDEQKEREHNLNTSRLSAVLRAVKPLTTGLDRSQANFG